MVRILWTKHAAAEAIEDDFDTQLIESNMGKVVELPEFNGEKKRGILRVNTRYCTLIYKKKKHGLIIITCWESNPTDIKEYKRVLKEKRRNVK